MIKKLIQFISLCLVILIGSCKKDPPINSDNPILADTLGLDICSQMYEIRSEPLLGNFYKGFINPPCSVTPNYILIGKYSYKHPIRNPNNPFEFAFLRFETGVQSGFSSDLCVYNFCSNSLNIIGQQVAYTPDWSVKNWIIYTSSDKQLYKVKSNGDSLVQLTNTGNYNNHAKWNNDGTKYLYSDIGAGKMRISNADGSFNQFIEQGMQQWAWLNNEEIIHDRFKYIINQWAYSGIYKYNINTSEEIELAIIKTSGVSLFYINNNNIYFNGEDGIYSLNNNILTLIDSTYKSFGSTHVQPLTNDLLLFTRTIIDTIGFDSCIAYYRKFFSLYDINTKEEREIKLPE